jgi:phosphate transport system ATP-binding protein
LCDEPTSALDPISSRNIESKLKELKNKYTIVIVTHILRQARRLADYVVLLYLGQLVEHGPAKDIMENPKEPVTQSYIRGEIS